MKYLPLLLLLTSCGQDPPVNPATANKLSNTATERQKLVEQFQTSEVSQLPYSAYEFIIRDRSGSIWYVNTQVRGTAAPGGTVLLFACENQVTWTIPGTPIIWVTNDVEVTNVVNITNHIVEDPSK